MPVKQKFFLFSEADDFSEKSGRAQWREDQQAMMLAQNQIPRLSSADWEQGQIAWQTASAMMLDGFDAIGEIIEDGSAFGFRNNGQDSAHIVEDQYSNPIKLEQGIFTDLHAGGDNRVSLGFSDEENSHYGLAVFHLRKRWLDSLTLPQAPLRVWTDALGQSWVLASNAVFLCAGQPLPRAYTPDKQRFEPLVINSGSLRLVRQIALPAEISQPLALCEDGDWLYVLVENRLQGVDQQQILVYPLNKEGEWLALSLPQEIVYATDMQPLGNGRLALMLPKAAADSDYKNRDCPLIQLPQNFSDDIQNANETDRRFTLLARRYPLLSQERARFVSSEDRRLRYIADDGVRELYPLAQARFYQQAEFNLLRQLDSGIADTQWHKLVLDACIPRGCQLSVSVYCSDEEHTDDDKEFLPQHRPLWTPLNSEQAYHPGWRTPKRGEQGVFEILLQRPEGEVRELRGRYLQLRLTLSGDGRSSPAIHAIRVYYPRLCWQEHFLPQHFHQQKAVDKNEAGAANGADIRQRIFASLECMLTPLEERIASAEYLFDPQAAPLAMLPNIANLLGIRSLPAHWPEARQRRLIREAGRLQQTHGSYAGLVLALDIATDGAVAAGQIVPLENFRFRRTLATILGVSFDDAEHPLTLGSGQNANSIVGDSLILTKKGAREFLALLSPDSYGDADNSALSDQQLVEDFFDKYAHQLSVLLHGEAGRWLNTAQEVLQKYAPAHLQWRVKATEHPFVLGLAPLLQIDTYLEHKPGETPVVLNHTKIGRGAQLHNEAALSAVSQSYSPGTML